MWKRRYSAAKQAEKVINVYGKWETAPIPGLSAVHDESGGPESSPLTVVGGVSGVGEESVIGGDDYDWARDGLCELFVGEESFEVRGETDCPEAEKKKKDGTLVSVYGEWETAPLPGLSWSAGDHQ